MFQGSAAGAVGEPQGSSLPAGTPGRPEDAARDVALGVLGLLGGGGHDVEADEREEDPVVDEVNRWIRPCSKIAAWSTVRVLQTCFKRASAAFPESR